MLARSFLIDSWVAEAYTRFCPSLGPTAPSTCSPCVPTRRRPRLHPLAPPPAGGSATWATRSTIGPRPSQRAGASAYKRRKINLSLVFARQNVGVKQVSDRIWLVTFMLKDVGYFDDETCRLGPIENPFGPKVYLCLRNNLLQS